MKKLLILGCGGHGKVVADAAEISSEYQNISFLDQKNKKSKGLNTNFCQNIIGDLSESNLEYFSSEFSHAFVGIGDNATRVSWLKKLNKLGFKIPNIIHPDAQISKYVEIGFGSFINANAVLQCNVKINSGCIINTSSSIDHDSTVDIGSHISPGVNIAGNVNIGQNVWIGIGSTIIQNIDIGDNVIVGAGSLVLKDIPKNVKAYGVPSKIIREI